MASILAILSVALGAFAAHSLKESVSDVAVNIFETGVKYQFYHTLAIFFAAILYKDYSNRWMKTAGYFFIAGILLFSGSLYMLTYVKAAVLPGYRWIGPLTPVGGLCFILGWLCILVAVSARKLIKS